MSKALEEMTEQVCGFLVKEHSSRHSEQVQRPWVLSTSEVQGQQKVSVAGQCVERSTGDGGRKVTRVRGSKG